LVVSVIATFVYATWANVSAWPGGQEKLPGPGGESVRLWEIVPFFPELNAPLALIGSPI
jgi:hypothetical protein